MTFIFKIVKTLPLIIIFSFIGWLSESIVQPTCKTGLVKKSVISDEISFVLHDAKTNPNYLEELTEDTDEDFLVPDKVLFISQRIILKPVLPNYRGKKQPALILELLTDIPPPALA